MTDRRPGDTASKEGGSGQATERPAGTEALVLDPPAAVPAVSQDQAAASMKVDEDTAKQISTAVQSFVDSLVALDVHSPEYEQKLDSVSRLGNQEVRRSAEVSNRFLERPATSLERGRRKAGRETLPTAISRRTRRDCASHGTAATSARR